MFSTNKLSTVLAGFNKFGFHELVFDLKYFLLNKNFGFNEYPGLTNYLLGPERFVKSGDHCIYLSIYLNMPIHTRRSPVPKKMAV